MIIEVEERFGKVANLFSMMLNKVQCAAQRGAAVHEVEEMIWCDLIKTGRETIVAFIKEQEEELPRREVIEHEGKPLRRLPKRRVRPYMSAFGPAPFARDVYATRETQRQEVVPLDARLGMPESDTSYLLQKWSGTQFVNESYQESRTTLQSILGFAPSVNCLEDMAAQASDHAEVYFDQQGPVDPTTEAEIVVATSDCKGVPMRKVDAPRTVVAVMDGETKLRDLQELNIQRAIGILCQRAVKSSQVGRMKSSHFEQGEIRVRVSSTLYPLMETLHGESTQYGTNSGDRTATNAKMVPAEDRSGAWN